jgi:hypothetical protein
MRRLLVMVPLLATLVLPANALAFGNVFRAVRGNPADRLADVAVDDYSYDTATKCMKGARRGTLALQSWLGSHAGGVSWGINRCEKWGKNSASLHAEGRALDWHLDVHDKRDKAEAERIISLLLAPDKRGNMHALARRMGVQEIIWNCQGWFSGDGGMRPYSACYDKKGRHKRVDDTNAHRNHIHLGLNWAGAKLKTSFWRASASVRR